MLDVGGAGGVTPGGADEVGLGDCLADASAVASGLLEAGVDEAGGVDGAGVSDGVAGVMVAIS